jgi:hypothetical protein
MRMLTSFSVAVSLAALATGCSSSSSGTTAADDGGTDTAGVTADQAATDAANAYCARVAACTPFYTLVSYGDQATCASRMKTQFLGALGATGTGSTPALFEGCAGSIPGVSCADLFAANLGTACQPVAGTGAKGSVCADHSQCVTKFCGVDAAKGVCGVCADPPAAEASCITGDCQDGYTCGGDSKCHKIGALGDTCDANRTCNSTLTCFGGKCVTPGAVGAACDPAAKPTLAACDGVAGLWCNLKSKKCEKTVENAAAGASCGLNATTGTLTVCDAKNYCKITSATTYAGTCVARVADGGACDAATLAIGGPCITPATCTAGKCVVKDPTTCK